MRFVLPACIVVSLLGVVTAGAGGCGGVALPPGAESGSVVAPPSACSADGTYYKVTGMDCGFLNCPAGLTGPAYALCDGTSFSSCTCTQPPDGSGWTEIPQGGGPKDGGVIKTYDTYVPDVPPPPKDTGVDTTLESGGDTGPADTGPSDTGTTKDAPPG